jgi:hypothetical protein
MLPKCNISGTVNAGRGFGVLPTSFEQEIVENSDAVPISGLRRTTQGNSMIDPEVARLRRLRSEALLVREVARTLASTPWAAKESLLDRTACASWRIARIVSGRLRSHPYAAYQKDAGAAARLADRLHASYLALTHKNRLRALRALQQHVNTLGRRLDDAIALAWSSDFSEALSRSQFEIKALGAAIASQTLSGVPQERPAGRAPARTDGMAGNLGAALEGDWPYLAL